MWLCDVTRLEAEAEREECMCSGSKGAFSSKGVMGALCGGVAPADGCDVVPFTDTDAEVAVEGCSSLLMPRPSKAREQTMAPI